MARILYHVSCYTEKKKLKHTKPMKTWIPIRFVRSPHQPQGFYSNALESRMACATRPPSRQPRHFGTRFQKDIRLPNATIRRSRDMGTSILQTWACGCYQRMPFVVSW